MNDDTKKSCFRPSRVGASILVGAAVFYSNPKAALSDPVKSNEVTAAQAVHRIEKDFGVTIDVSGAINLQQQVRVTLPNAQNTHALLSAVDALATAMHADYRKEFVITPVSFGIAPVVPEIDNLQAVASFDNETQTAVKAIAAVADSDDASVQFTSPVEGTVTFSNRNLGVGDAAGQIANQTHTDWKTVFVLTPHTNHNSPSGRIVGYTGGGQPIIEVENVRFPAGLQDSAASSSPNPNEPPLQDPVYQSAIVRGDVSAMYRFQNNGIPTK